MLSLCRQTDGQTDGQTDNGKTTSSDLSILGHKNGKTKIYFDSYGIQPPFEIRESLGSPIHYNTDQLQRAGLVFCGHLFLYVLKELASNNKFQNVLNRLF